VISGFRYFKELYFTFALLLLIIFVGTEGYVLLEDYNYGDAFYMTIITLSTVGFKEVQPLSDDGKMFTAFLIITGFTTFAYALTSITRNIISGQYRQYFRVYKVNKEIGKIKGHVIICGLGRNGMQSAKSLQAYNKKFVIIEQNEKTLEYCRDQKWLFVQGDATEEETMREAGIVSASALITTLPKDADNVFVTLTARDLNPSLTLISRATNESAERKLRRAGADNIIMPERVGGMHMASLVVTPDVYEFLDRISVIGSDEVNLEEIAFEKVPADCKYKTLEDLTNRFHTGCLIVGYKTPDGEYIVNPDMNREVIQGSKIFLLGKSEQIKELNRLFNINA
jgi:voltage-gated potassium channel